MGAVDTVDLSQPLADLLREGTKQAHTDVQTSQEAQLLLSGKLPKDEYVRFLMILWYVYDEIERALDRHSTYPTLEPTYNPALLARATRLSDDISHLLDVPGDSWKAHPMHQALATPQLPEALTTYLSRVRTLSDSADPSALLAHSYVRYLGDLSGGQTIKRIMGKAYGLESEEGLSFYVFKELRSAQSASIGEMKKIKEWFREGMNLAAERCGSPEAKLAIVEEAGYAYRLNMDVFSAIRLEPEAPPLKKNEAATGRTFPLGSVLAVIMAVCLGHFLLVIGGFTGNTGYEKLLAAEQWFAELFLPSRSA